ncbi:hypothetical protein CEXT_113301 [Caerostris extrusa]|uniref:Uncharacterized protein n=1 Tax=Caerostris extrusa TaxID=172846 RepID=A0AAV4Y1U6_CAEEX|nr:hypothetical protein CEXT_113301 [Caerostris extrusa]
MLYLVVLSCLSLAQAQFHHDNHHHHHAQPYKFGYSVKDHHGEQHRGIRKRCRRSCGKLRFHRRQGIARQVNYVADHAGFRAQPPVLGGLGYGGNGGYVSGYGGYGLGNGGYGSGYGGYGLVNRGQGLGYNGYGGSLGYSGLVVMDTITELLYLVELSADMTAVTRTWRSKLFSLNIIHCDSLH